MLKLKTVPLSDALRGSAPVALFAHEGPELAAPLPPALKKALTEKARAEGFEGKAGESVRLHLNEGGREKDFYLAGLGKKAEVRGEAVRKAAGLLYKAAKKRFPALAVVAPADVQAAAEGLLLASYRFDEYRKPEEGVKLREAFIALGEARAKAKAEPLLEKARLYAEAVCFARDLVNRGPSDKSPEAMGRIAEGLEGDGVSVKLIGAAEAKKLGMGSFLSVARGSSVPPCFVHLSYKPKGAKRRLGLVGKGITFDSGGLSLKPPQSMEEMKMDMAGAASVLAAFKVLARLKPKSEVHGYCAFTYNMPGPDATKPGDVVKAMNGKTIEILNTDAEGRLVLADALVYAARQGMDELVDLATLTGAALIALGSRITAAMGNDKKLLARLMAAAERADEPMWELPLFSEYKEGIKSSIADVRNISKVRGEAGTIIGGLFLQEFAEGKPWVHLDIAGPVWANADGEYFTAGGTGAVVRTVLEYITAVN